MKFFLSIFLTICYVNIFGQTCDTLQGRIINCKDKDSLKQGFWFEYKIQRILTTDSFNRNPAAVGYHNDIGMVYNPIAEGYYKNDIKIGKWKYYEGWYNDPYAHEKTVIFTDSGYRYEIDSFYHYNFQISDDTSRLTGKIFLKDDTLSVICHDNKCNFLNSKMKVVEKFKQQSLKGKIRLVNFRSYRRLGYWKKQTIKLFCVLKNWNRSIFPIFLSCSSSRVSLHTA